MTFQLEKAVVFFIYKRADLTQQVFDAIAVAKPPQLFIVADGPKSDVETQACEQTRAVTEQITWQCDVFRNYAESNMGLQQRIATGIDWVFEHTTEAIMLEDDTLPHPSFFQFCQEMLDRYCGDTRIFHISGNNFQPPENTTGDSYFFSQYPHYWGWATWKRAWQHYDVTMQAWRTAEDKAIYKSLLNDPDGWYFWHRRWNRVIEQQIDSYSYPWIFTCLLNQGWAVEPCVNLVTNIGFGENSTHTKDPDDPLSHYPVEEIHFPLKHPEQVALFRAADTYKVKQFFYAH